MRIAVVIGINEYENYNDLPGCVNDIKAISDVVSNSKEFEEVKIFSGNVQSSNLKTQLSRSFAEWKGKEIDEFFLYFSGHGNFFNDEFYYILSDFDENQRRQTSLQNLEIDNMIKSIKPKMVTKVIDACQSGVSYIKGNTNILEKYYSKTTDSFEKCYFLHSSMTSQYSYQNDDLSDFTKSFLESIALTKKPAIRYKDVIDYISDQFENSAEQTPFFITQADHTEIFLHSSEELNKIISKYIKKESTKTDLIKVEPVKYNSYIEKIKKEAESFSSQEEVHYLLLNIQEVFDAAKLTGDLKEIYTLNLFYENYLRDLPKAILIGRWLEENPNTYFAVPDYERVSYQEEETPTSMRSISLLLRKTQKTVTKYRNELRGFNHSIDLVYKSITFELVPKFPNLFQYGLLVTFLISKKDIKIYHAFSNYFDLDWEKREINKNFKWQSADFEIKDESKIINHIKGLIKESEQNVLNAVKQKYDSEK